MYVRHRPEDHGKQFYMRKKDDPAQETTSKPTGGQSKSLKLKLSESMKTALLTMGTFTEEQADAIVQETQSHMPKDF